MYNCETNRPQAQMYSHVSAPRVKSEHMVKQRGKGSNRRRRTIRGLVATPTELKAKNRLAKNPTMTQVTVLVTEIRTPGENNPVLPPQLKRFTEV